MKVLVAVKRVLDYSVRVRVNPDGSGVDLNGAKMSINPFDEIAVEEALRMKESGKAGEVVAVSVGSEKSADTLRTALAMGADRAILVIADGDVEPLAVAKILKGVVEEEGPEVVILGKQAIDDDCNQTGQMLSALLGWGLATFASEIVPGDGKLTVTREIDGGLQRIEVHLPAVVTTDLRLNEPRYASLPNIMKAKRKPLDKKMASEYRVEIAPRLTVVSTEAPSQRSTGELVPDVATLVSRLKERGVL